MANVAEFERDMIKERTRMGMEAMARDGRWPNDRPPLGYEKADDGRLQVNDRERKLVKSLFRKYLKEQSMGSVADWLNRNNYSTKSSSEWNARRVGEILRNELYLGVYFVAGISKYVPEYRIIEPSQFLKVIQTRRRFQSSTDQDQERMSAKRKKKLVERVLDGYLTYLSTTDKA